MASNVAMAAYDTAYGEKFGAADNIDRSFMSVVIEILVLRPKPWRLQRQA